jgi:hypothetical protein
MAATRAEFPLDAGERFLTSPTRPLPPPSRRCATCSARRRRARLASPPPLPRRWKALYERGCRRLHAPASGERHSLRRLQSLQARGQLSGKWAAPGRPMAARATMGTCAPSTTTASPGSVSARPSRAAIRRAVAWPRGHATTPPASASGRSARTGRPAAMAISAPRTTPARRALAMAAPSGAKATSAPAAGRATHSPACAPAAPRATRDRPATTGRRAPSPIRAAAGRCVGAAPACPAGIACAEPVNPPHPVIGVM